MNHSAPSPSTRRGMADEPDDPGPSQVADATDGSHEPVLRIGGEAAAEVDLPWLRKHLAAAARLLPVAVRRVHVQVVHDDRMTALHEKHLGIPETTDVLTFSEQAASAEGSIVADIAVCLDEARWRADQYEHAVERELLLYALHGMLHCAGYDDHDEASFTAMHAEEDRILEAIGVGRTFWTGEEVGEAGAAGHDAGHAMSERDQGSKG